MVQMHRSFSPYHRHFGLTNSCVFLFYLLFSSVQSRSCVRLVVTPWTAARQALLSFTNSQSLLKLMSIELVMSSNHLILCCPLLLPSIFPSIRVFFNESVPPFKRPKYWSITFFYQQKLLSPSVWRHKVFGLLSHLSSGFRSHVIMVNSSFHMVSGPCCRKSCLLRAIFITILYCISSFPC